jgi:glycine cleavage system regulatory protein
LTEEQEFAFEVEVSNKKRKDATVLTVKGPDVDGLLASMTAAIAEFGCKLVELHASSRSTGYIEDVFVVKPRGQSRGQMEDGELDDLARKLLAASRDPLSAHTLKTEVQKLRAKNQRLRERVTKLIHKLEDQQITIETLASEEQVNDNENKENDDDVDDEEENDETSSSEGTQYTGKIVN